MSALRALAPAKVNLGLWLGPARSSDGRHEIATVMQAISLADEIVLEPAGAAADGDQLVCPGVRAAPQENLAAAALSAFRSATGWRAGPQRLSIRKRIPVAAGLGGGSADAAAALRLARLASGLGDERLLLELASSLGADVPALVKPGRWLATGAGERLEPLPDPSEAIELLVLPLAVELSTARVYTHADALALPRPSAELARVVAGLRAALGGGAPLPGDARLLQNDLQRAACSLCPQIEPALEQLRAAGARCAFVSGSGPTVVGVFAPPRAGQRADRALAQLSSCQPAPVRASSVSASFARPQPVAPHSA